ncbi:hypothetical protein CK203_011445 [Vitis vinifera]|uniref:PHD and RING finger domain-containing protein 1 n=1 Tax=Vitis vinifera TaxID=29760 RepID=A0A438JYX8_VITVI|nr:hypothetical protein CK203_011445 [Vitis vinifera]
MAEATDKSPRQRSDSAIEYRIAMSSDSETLGSDISANQCPKAKEAVDFDSNCCGICLLEDDRAIRGWVDSCDHYFCFVCIMEWAKVESRCPMCKRRFSTIRRPPSPVSFLPSALLTCLFAIRAVGESCGSVPTFILLYLWAIGNVCVTIGIVGSYLTFKGVLCISDALSHAYHHFGNVTTGPSDPYAEVDCGICHGTADESFLLICDLCDSAAHTYCVGLGHTVPEGDWFCHDCTVSRAEHANGEIDAVFDDRNNFRNFYRKPSAETHVSICDIVAEPYTREDERPPSIGSSHPNRPSSPIALNSENFAVNNSSSMSVARTLLRCRNVNAHIQALRENWNALRSGSMTFSSILGDSGGESSQKYNVGASCPKQDNNACSYDTEKAWKMMDKAKSIQRACERTGIIHQKSENQEQGRVTRTGIPKFTESSLTIHSLVSFDSPSSRKAETSFQVDVHHRNGVRLSQKNLGDSFNAINERDGYGSLIIPDGPVPRSPDLSHANLKFGASSLCKEDLLHRPKGRVEIGSAKNKARRDDDAKSEIQSLVKLNLKLISKDKQLGVDTFKEVARLATHTILAACGLEHSKSCVRSFPTSMCTHSEQVQQLHKSTLMPRSCRECFYAYVKDVVNFITVEKMGSTGSCRSYVRF